jgi:cell division protein FtsW
VVGVIFLFGMFAVIGYRIALEKGVGFAGFASFGLTSLIVLQALTNMAVVVGLIPATGIPLPFFSSGGSSLLANLIMIGLLGAFSRADGASEEDLDG